MTDPAPPARTTLTESEAYRIAAGALRHIPSGYAVEGQQCGDSVVAALLHFTKKAFAEGRLAGLEEAALDCVATAALVPGTSMNIGLRAQAIAIRALRGLAGDGPKAPKDHATPSDPDPR